MTVMKKVMLGVVLVGIAAALHFNEMHYGTFLFACVLSGACAVLVFSE